VNNDHVSSDRAARRHCAAILIAVFVCGCGNEMATYPVDPDEARSTLDAVLTSWQEGATPESWQSESPSVVVQDADWSRGAKLKDYEIIEPTEAIDANLHCEVRLTLDVPQQGEVQKTVKYVVGTSPVLTVFRFVEM